MKNKKLLNFLKDIGADEILKEEEAEKKEEKKEEEIKPEEKKEEAKEEKKEEKAEAKEEKAEEKEEKKEEKAEEKGEEKETKKKGKVSMKKAIETKDKIVDALDKCDIKSLDKILLYILKYDACEKVEEKCEDGVHCESVENKEIKVIAEEVESTEPQEEDIAIQDEPKGGYNIGYVGHNFIGHAKDWDEVRELVMRELDGAFNPDIWLISDHGNATIINSDFYGDPEKAVKEAEAKKKSKMIQEGKEEIKNKETKKEIKKEEPKKEIKEEAKPDLITKRMKELAGHK
jgi:hypothetical protein